MPNGSPDSSSFILVLVMMAVFLILSTLIRGRRRKKTDIDIVAGLLGDVTYNLQLVENFSGGWWTQKLRASTWEKSKDSLGFMEQELRLNLTDAFSQIEEINRGVAAAKKFKSPAYLSSASPEDLKKPLIRSRDGLQAWLEKRMAKERGVA